MIDNYEIRKRISLLSRELEHVEKEITRLKKDRQTLKEQKHELIGQIYESPEVKTTKTAEEFEQIEITGKLGKKLRVQVRHPKTGLVVSSLFVEFQNV